MNGPIDFILNIIKNLINKKILGKNDFKMYKAFIKDLSKFGFIFSNNFNKYINYNEKDYLNRYSKLYINTLSMQNILLKNSENKFRLLKHKSSNFVYNDILLAINFNREKYININNYLFQFYRKYFKYIIFISPGKTIYKNTILCPESYIGYFAYICYRKIYNKYPKLKGYLIINDDNFLKPWEIENLNFDLPWINYFDFKRKHVDEFSGNKILKNIINNNKIVANNIFKLMGNYLVPKLWIDSIYFPNSILIKLFDIFEKMYKQKIFLEIAVPSAFAIKSIDKFQIINSKLIWLFNRRFMNYYLMKSFNYVCVHPIKTSNYNLRYALYKYIYFRNGNEY